MWWNQLWRFGARPLLTETADRRLGPLAAKLRRRRAVRRAPEWLRPEVGRELAAEGAARRSRTDSFYWREIERSIDHPLVALTREEIHESGRSAGVALRAPFEDDEMVEILARVPPRRLLQGGRSKGLVREYLRHRADPLGGLGADLRHQRKVSFTGLFRDAVRLEAESCRDRLGGFRALAALDLVEPRALDRVVRRAHHLRTGAETLPLWSALVVESWLRREVAA